MSKVVREGLRLLASALEGAGGTMELVDGGGQGRDKQGFHLEIDAADLKELGGQRNWKVGCILE